MLPQRRYITDNKQDERTGFLGFHTSLILFIVYTSHNDKYGKELKIKICFLSTLLQLSKS